MGNICASVSSGDSGHRHGKGNEAQSSKRKKRNLNSSCKESVWSVHFWESTEILTNHGYL